MKTNQLPVSSATVFTVRALYRSELARAYGISGKVFRQRLQRSGLDFGRAKLLMPNEVAQVIDKLGIPEWDIREPE